jgi:hypothetical protein
VTIDGLGRGEDALMRRRDFDAPSKSAVADRESEMFGPSAQGTNLRNRAGPHRLARRSFGGGLFRGWWKDLDFDSADDHTGRRRLQRGFDRCHFVVAGGRFSK